MNNIGVFRPASDVPINDPKGYRARVDNEVRGPFGYGSTAQEAIADLKKKLHERVDNMIAYYFNHNGNLVGEVESPPLV